MTLKLVAWLFFSVKIRSEQFYPLHSHDVINNKDIYTNYQNEEKVLRSYKDVYEIPYTRFPRKIKQKVSPVILEESAYMDRIDFHYPQVEFLTKNDNLKLEADYNDYDNHFSFLQSLAVTDSNADETKPNFTLYEYKPVRLSYVQKIPKPNVQKNSRYEEISTGSSEAAQGNDTKEKINNLLKKYLNKLYVKKYNFTETTTLSSEIENFSDASESAETKFFNKNLLLANKKKNINKIKKLFSIFTILQFNNTQCNATSSTGSYLGVCYTATECTNLGGTAIGNCASGYGVCCVFRGTCGGTAAQNCSYFESPNYPDYYPPGGGVINPSTLAPPTTANPSPTPDPRLAWYFFKSYDKNNMELARQSVDPTLSCIFSVYKINNMVKKMKIDFLDFELTGPTNGMCTVERLVITGQSTNSIVPTFCGYNTGQSIYVDVSQSSGPLRLMVLSTMTLRKKFRFRICQYTTNCLQDNCLQIYDGVTGTISSFNYDQSAMFNRSVPGYFNNLNYAICIQKAPGYCSITYTNVINGMENPFNLVNFANGVSTVPFGMAGVDVMDCPNDYIVIDGTRLCGYKFNDGSVVTNLSLNAAVTDTNAGPIVIPVRTNAAAVGYGFKLFYTQNRCPTT